MAPKVKKRKPGGRGDASPKGEAVQRNDGNSSNISQAQITGSKYSAIPRLATVLVVACVLFFYVHYPAPKFSKGLTDWKDSGFNFSYEGFQVFYQDIFSLNPFRKKPVLLIIHGFPTSSYDWKKVIFSLTSKFGRVIGPDMLGFGFSDKPTYHNYTVSEQATMHEKLLDHLGIEDVHLLAHDLGDTVAQEMLARFEDRKRNSAKGINILSLCFSNGGIIPETHQPRLIQRNEFAAKYRQILTRITGRNSEISSELSTESSFMKSVSQLVLSLTIERLLRNPHLSPVVMAMEDR